MSSAEPSPLPAPPGPEALPGAGAGEELPNLRHLRLLDAAVRHGSLSLAAAEVLVTQPAASQGIARLGRLFGVTLLQRMPQGVAPTPEGLIVQRRGRRALDHLREANRRLAQRSRLGRALVGDLIERHATMAQLRAIAAFAAAGSFSGAARALGQTEPSVQRAAREVERLLGVALFEGTYRSLHLTPAGQTLAEHASLALREIAAARAELRERAGLYDGRLVVGTLPLARTRLVPEAVLRLLARHPEARIEIVDGPYETLVQALRMGACDLIVGALRADRRPSGLAETVLFEDDLAILARAGHPLAGRPLAGPELAAFPWVLPRQDTPSRAIFEALRRERGVMRPGAGHVETGSLVALRGILLGSDAVTILSPRQVEYEIGQGLLTVLDLQVPPQRRPIGITTLEGWAPTALQARFVELLTAIGRQL